MTIASTTHADCRQPEGIDRLAQRLGLALVAWGERSVNRPDLTEADLHLVRQMERAADQLLSDRADSRAERQRLLF